MPATPLLLAAITGSDPFPGLGTWGTVLGLVFMHSGLTLDCKPLQIRHGDEVLRAPGTEKTWFPFPRGCERNPRETEMCPDWICAVKRMAGSENALLSQIWEQ